VALKTATSGRGAEFSELVPIATAAITTLAMLGWLLLRCNFGFDFTDESFYFNWISNPFIYSVSASQFGYIYHPLYQIVDGDVAQLRQSNLMITFGLAWVLCLVLLRPVFHIQNRLPSWNALHWLVVSATLASTSMTSLVFSGYWLPTPSYNTLAFNALLIAGIGVLLADETNTRVGVAGWIFIGVGGWLAFMAKPTTALALGCTILIYLLIAGRFNLRGLAISVATSVALLVCSAWLIDGSVMLFIKRLGDASEYAAVLGGKHTLGDAFRWDGFQLSQREIVEFWLATLIVFIAVVTSAVERTAMKIANAGIVIMIATIILAIIFEMYFPSLSRTRFHGLLVWAATAGALLAIATVFQKKLLEAFTRKDFALALCFLVLPHAYAFGTGTNYWGAATAAGFFWIISGVALLCAMSSTQRGERIILQLAIGAQAIVIVLIYIGMENPYRQTQPLRMNTSVVEMGGAGATLLSSEDVATYLNGLRQAAAKAGFKPGMPMIDMTGHYPGSLYALGAQAIGQAWSIGGYKGSEQLAIKHFDKVPCEQLTIAWILTEPLGPRSISNQLISRYGADMQKDFVEVARLRAPAGGYEQILYRPIRESQQADVACQKQRNQQ